MKHILTYEKLKSNPQIGDYVLCIDRYETVNKKVIEFIENNIGQIVEYTKLSGDISPEMKKVYPYVVKYKIPKDFFSFDEFNDNFTVDERPKLRLMGKKEIIFFSPNLKDAKDFLTAKKFNI